MLIRTWEISNEVVFFQGSPETSVNILDYAFQDLSLLNTNVPFVLEHYRLRLHKDRHGSGI